MEGISIFNAVTLFRNASPTQIMNIISGFRERDNDPFEYSITRIKDFHSAISRLSPLVMSSYNRFLFCRGRNGTYSVYSNMIFGSAAYLAGPASSKLNCDSFYAFWQDRKLARTYDTSSISKDPIYYFNLELFIGGENALRRTIGCTIRANGHLFHSREGELLSFENPGDYHQLEEGVPPGMHILRGFCGMFGWPSPESREYPEFIEACELFEFKPPPNYPERPVSRELETQALRWPWIHKGNFNGSNT